MSINMGSANVLDIICGLEELARSPPLELRRDPVLRRRLYDAVQKLVPEVETAVEMSQRLLYMVSLLFSFLVFKKAVANSTLGRIAMRDDCSQDRRRPDHI
jgi:hypothetical protein